MREGVHVYIDDQDRLTCEVVVQQQTQWLMPFDIAAYLIDFIEYDFTGYLSVIDALYELPIFGEYITSDTEKLEESLDVRYADLEECRELCRDIAAELEDVFGSLFILGELNQIDMKEDDGSASFWLHQARDMVEALRSVESAHTFISRAFDICFGNSDGVLPDRAKEFFKQYPDLLGHTFIEVFGFLPQTDGRLDFEQAERLADKFTSDSDGYFATLHEDQDSLSIVKGNLIRTHMEFLFFSFLELLRRGTRIQRCECCGSYFIPKTKKKTLYCDRVLRDEKTCKDIGPKLMQRYLKSADAAGAIEKYDKLYKMYYARAERYECRTDPNREKTGNDLTYDEFYTWSARAARARRQYVSGEISADEFLAEISMDIEFLT